MHKNRRASWHDYTLPSYYHLTLMKAPGIPPFSEVIAMGDKQATVKYTPSGRAIRNSLMRLQEIDPALRLLQYVIMPDHVHMLLQVTAQMDEILGRKIAAFKVLANNTAGGKGLFNAGFHDRILTSRHKLNTVFKYIRENPKRLIVRQQFPEYFSRVNCLSICGHRFQTYGNLMLLRNPFMEAVAVHRGESDEEKKRNRDYWSYTAANGGVLISPFISKDEKAIRTEAIEAGGRLIVIQDKPLSDRDKPYGTDFDLCTSGRMLLLAPIDVGFAEKGFRDKCLTMNRLAEDIAASQRE